MIKSSNSHTSTRRLFCRKTRSTTLNAAQFQENYANALRMKGWVVHFEVPLEYESEDGFIKNGRIDLVAERKGRKVAYELDRGNPRKKSIEKLYEFQCDAAYVICRSGIIVQLKGNSNPQDLGK